MTPSFSMEISVTWKDVNLGSGGWMISGRPAALEVPAGIYKYWIAYADLDGYRVDTVKHMDPGATRYFASVIHEFAQSLGKENFYLIGEITGDASGRSRPWRKPDSMPRWVSMTSRTSWNTS